MSIKSRILDLPRGLTTSLLRPLERRLVDDSKAPRHGELFVVGPPRSGSTLFYELLVTRFRFAYFSNLAHALYRTPVAATRLHRGAIARWQGNFASDYGRIAGWAAPNEGVRIWRRWIPEETYLDESAATCFDPAPLVGTVRGIAHQLGAPFLNKNAMHSVHMRLLDRVFPGCLFIELRRRLFDNVRSILAMRERYLGKAGVRRWWSVRPRGWRAYEDEDRVDQACAQVLLTHADIAADAVRLGPARRLVVAFEELCREPQAELSRVAEFLAAHGIAVAPRAAVPVRFPLRGRSGAADFEREVERAAERIRMRLANGAR